MLMKGYMQSDEREAIERVSRWENERVAALARAVLYVADDSSNASKTLSTSSTSRERAIN